MTPAAFALSQACQAAVSIMLTMPEWGWPDLDAITLLFGQVPAPQTYGDASHAAQLLCRFLDRTALEFHARLHGGAVPASCLFDAKRYIRLSRIDQVHPEWWNAASIFADWC